MNGIVFVAGVYGVGKSTLCEKLGKKLSIPFFSAGDLICEKNGEKYGVNKAVKDKVNNQQILTNVANNISIYNSSWILAGHFCIFDKNNQIEYLPEFVYDNIDLKCIILLEADSETIINNLYKRDNKNYDIELIKELIKKEREQAEKISNKLNIPLFIHKMKFDNTDINILLSNISKL